MKGKGEREVIVPREKTFLKTSMVFGGEKEKRELSKHQTKRRYISRSHEPSRRGEKTIRGPSSLKEKGGGKRGEKGGCLHRAEEASEDLFFDLEEREIWLSAGEEVEGGGKKERKGRSSSRRWDSDSSPRNLALSRLGKTSRSLP